jgi:hypothetical protein
MIAATTLVFDTTGLKPIQPSGFVPPSQRTGYSDPVVQDFLQDAFGGQFPKLESFKENAAVYRNENPAAGSLIDCVAAKSLKDIPQPEIMRLLQGWITLRRSVMETAAPEGVRSLLMNLRIPDPRVAPHFYRIGNVKTADPKLYVLTGFEGPTAPSVTLEEGIAAMLQVSPSQLESLLASSMTSSPSTPSSTAVHSAPAGKSHSSPSAPSGVRNVALLFASAALFIFAVGVVWKMNSRQASAPAHELTTTHAPPVSPRHEIEPAQEVPPPVTQPVVSAAEPAAPPPAASAKTAPLPTLDAMSTGIPPHSTTSQPASQPADLTNLMAQ